MTRNVSTSAKADTFDRRLATLFTCSSTRRSCTVVLTAGLIRASRLYGTNCAPGWYGTACTGVTTFAVETPGMPVAAAAPSSPPKTPPPPPPPPPPLLLLGYASASESKAADDRGVDESTQTLDAKRLRVDGGDGLIVVVVVAVAVVRPRRTADRGGVAGAAG